MWISILKSSCYQNLEVFLRTYVKYLIHRKAHSLFGILWWPKYSCISAHCCRLLLVFAVKGLFVLIVIMYILEKKNSSFRFVKKNSHNLSWINSLEKLFIKKNIIKNVINIWIWCTSW